MGTHNSNCKIIAIAGPTASGKTTLANLLKKILGYNKTVVINQDNYYRDWSHLTKKKRKKINFDSLNSFDWKLLLDHLNSLKNGKYILAPQYDFVLSRRYQRTNRTEAKQFIIVEGLMPYFNKKFHNLFNYKIYINTNNAICLARRIKRDTKERGDNIESVCRRYFNDVLPMQKRYVEPQKKTADLVIEV